MKASMLGRVLAKPRWPACNASRINFYQPPTCSLSKAMLATAGNAVVLSVEPSSRRTHILYSPHLGQAGRLCMSVQEFNHAFTLGHYGRHYETHCQQCFELPTALLAILLDPCKIRAKSAMALSHLYVLVRQDAELPVQHTPHLLGLAYPL